MDSGDEKSFSYSAAFSPQVQRPVGSRYLDAVQRLVANEILDDGRRAAGRLEPPAKKQPLQPAHEHDLCWRGRLSWSPSCWGASVHNLTSSSDLVSGTVNGILNQIYGVVPIAVFALQPAWNSCNWRPASS